MQTVRAYFDGEQIRLVEPLDLRPQDQLLVTLLRDNIASPADVERAAIVDAGDDDFLSDEEIAYYQSLR